jgi:hypothetical protein
MYARMQHRRRRPRGAVLVQVAVMSSVLMGFAALTIDIGSMYTVQAEFPTPPAIRKSTPSSCRTFSARWAESDRWR